MFFSKFQEKHYLKSEKTLWFSFRSDSNDVAKKLASCGLYFTKNQFHQLKKTKKFWTFKCYFCEVEKISDAYFSLIEPRAVSNSS